MSKCSFASSCKFAQQVLIFLLRHLIVVFRQGNS